MLGSGSYPWGGNFLCVTDFPKVQLPGENFQWIQKKESKNWLHDSSLGNSFFGSISQGNNQSMYQTVDYVVYMLRSCWPQILSTTNCSVQQHNRIPSTAVNIYLELKNGWQVCRDTGWSFFFPLGNIYHFVIINIKAINNIKTQSYTNPSYFPKGC